MPLELSEYRPLVEETLVAIMEDFRVAEAIAKQASTILARREARAGQSTSTRV